MAGNPGACFPELLPVNHSEMQQEGKLIFMVDDDRVILNLLEYVFQGKNGYRVKSFPSGEECLRNLHRKPDLVVLDYVLNEEDNTALNGMQTLRKIVEINDKLPVIILSGKTDDKTRKEFLSSGAKEVLGKDDYFVDMLDQIIAAELNSTS